MHASVALVRTLRIAASIRWHWAEGRGIGAKALALTSKTAAVCRARTGAWQFIQFTVLKTEILLESRDERGVPTRLRHITHGYGYQQGELTACLARFLPFPGG